MRLIPTRRRRRGNVAAEVVLMFPILVGFLLGTIEMSIAFYSRQQLLTASREGARVAARGGTVAEVEFTVKRVLGSGPLGDATVAVVTLPEDPGNARQAVQVCLEVDTDHVVPNLLPWLVNFEGEKLTACVIMNVE
jgi:Flp pilus assembly protein TadG